MCDDAVYAVQWSEEAAEVSVSDYFDHLTPDRFGNEIHPFGSPLEAVHTGDGSRIYFSAPEWPYAVVNVGTTASRPVPQSSRTRFGVHLEDGVAEVNVGVLFPDFFVAPSGTTPRYEVSASHPGFAARLEDGILSLARSDDSAESVTVTVTASWGATRRHCRSMWPSSPNHAVSSVDGAWLCPRLREAMTKIPQGQPAGNPFGGAERRAPAHSRCAGSHLCSSRRKAKVCSCPVRLARPQYGAWVVRVVWGIRKLLRFET